MRGSNLLSGQCEMLMELHRGHDREASLEAVVVVEIDVIRNHVHQLGPVGEGMAVVALALEDTPEALHRAVVNAVCHAGHTLLHPCYLQFLVKNSTCILEAPVAVK